MSKKPTKSSLSLRPIFIYLSIATILGTGFLIYSSAELKKQHQSSRITQESELFISEPQFEDVQETENNNIPPKKSLTKTKSNKWDTEQIKMPSYNSYKFNNPTLAYKILKQLDVFVPVNDSYFDTRTEGSNSYHIPWYGLINDDKYCDKNRAYFVEHPEYLFDSINFITGYRLSSIMRSKVLGASGTDIQPEVGPHMPKSKSKEFTYELRPDASLFYAAGIGLHKHIGKNVACITQAVNHIPGHTSLNRKDFVAEAAIKYAKDYKDRPQCFNHEKFFPETWTLYEKESCEQFFDKLNSEEYKKEKAEKKIVYIRKIGAGSHRGNGVFPVHDEEEQFIRKTYRNGTLCGRVNKNYIVQDYISNPLLLEGRKFDFRMYMLIASTNPLMVFYHDGFLRVSLANYDADTTDKKVLLTNLALNDEIYEEVKQGALFNGMDEEGLKLSQQWSFDRLQNYLLETGVISDPEWLENYLRPEFKKAMVHLIRMTSHTFLQRSSLYEIYGVDFMLDQNLNLWFIEANSGPAFNGYSEPMEEFITKMLKDHYEIVIGLLRSRMKRVLDYVNRVSESSWIEKKTGGSIILKDLDQRKKDFKILTRNYFEREFEPSKENGFSKIIDENYFAVNRFQRLISEECL